MAQRFTAAIKAEGDLEGHDFGRAAGAPPLKKAWKVISLDISFRHRIIGALPRSTLSRAAEQVRFFICNFPREFKVVTSDEGAGVPSPNW